MYAQNVKCRLFNKLAIILIATISVLMLITLQNRFDFAIIEDDADESYQKRADDDYLNFNIVVDKTINTLNNTNLIALIFASIIIYRLICPNSKPYYFYIELTKFFRPPPARNSQ